MPTVSASPRQRPGSAGAAAREHHRLLLLPSAVAGDLRDPVAGSFTWSPARASPTTPISFLNCNAWAKHSSPEAMGTVVRKVTNLLRLLVTVAWSLCTQVTLAFWPPCHMRSRYHLPLSWQTFSGSLMPISLHLKYFLIGAVLSYMLFAHRCVSVALASPCLCIWPALGRGHQVGASWSGSVQMY